MEEESKIHEPNVLMDVFPAMFSRPFDGLRPSKTLGRRSSREGRLAPASIYSMVTEDVATASEKGEKKDKKSREENKGVRHSRSETFDRGHGNDM